MDKGLTIAFFGSSLVSAYWNGAATYYRGIIRALYDLGHTVTFYEPDAYDRQLHRDIPNPSWARVVVYPATQEEHALRALEHARNADIIIKASGVGVFDELLEKAVLEIRKPDSMVIFWDVDAPATLDRVQQNHRDYFRKLIPRYDLILTYGGGFPVVEAYGTLGARECIPIYNALDQSTHYPTGIDKQFSGDLGFLGNRMPDREERVEDFFFYVARAVPEKRFVLGGNGWQEKHLPPNVSYVGHVYTKDHNAFNSSLHAVLNINRDSMAQYGFSPATRIFEAAGAGACIITDEWKGVELFFEPGEEILVARNGIEVARHLRDLTPHRAKKIGQAARRRAVSQHTYRHRALHLDEVLKVKVC